MTLNDDQRAAAAIKVGIGNYIGTVTFGLIAGSIALFTYFHGKMDVKWPFYVVGLLTLLTCVASLIMGGMGAGATLQEVAAGTWGGDHRTGFYSAQARLALLGLVGVIVFTLLGATADVKPSTEEKASYSQSLLTS